MRYTEIIPLREGITTQNFLDNLADAILWVFANQAPDRMKLWLKSAKKFRYIDNPEEFNNPQALGKVKIETVNKFTDLTPEQANFLTKQSGMTIGFGFTQPHQAAAYYTEQPNHPDNFIIMGLPDERMAEIGAMAKDRSLTPDAVYRVLAQSQKSNLVHELTHAYDDAVSGGKFMHNRRSGEAATAIRTRQKDAFAHYMNNPIEINARLTASLAHNRSEASHMTAPEFIAKVRKDFNGWDDLPPSDQRRLTTRIGGYFATLK